MEVFNASFPGASASSFFHLPPLSGRSPFPIYFIPLYHVFMVFSLLPAPGPARSWAVTSLIVAYLAYVMTLTNGSFQMDFAIYCVLATQVFQHVSLMHWVVPESDYVPPTPVDFGSTWAKLCWATTVVFSPRGVGWSHEAKCVPAMQRKVASLSRAEYVVSRLWRLAYYVAILDVQAAWRDSVFRNWSPENPTGITHLPWNVQIGVIWAHYLAGFAGIAAVYTTVALPLVGLGFFRPIDFPGLFGDVRNAYTVRRLWGDVWHQNMRNIFISASNTLLSTLRISRHTFSARCIQPLVAFVLSALLHELASILTCRADCGELYFFASQAVAIFVEDNVIDFGKHRLNSAPAGQAITSKHDTVDKKCGHASDLETPCWTKPAPKWYWRAIGYVWVFAWCSYSFRLNIDQQVRRGMYLPLDGHTPFSARWIK